MKNNIIKRAVKKVILLMLYGGYAARGWSYFMWDEDVAYMIGDSDGHLKRVNYNSELAGLPLIESWDDL